MVVRSNAILTAKFSQRLNLEAKPAEITPLVDGTSTPTRVNILAYTGGLVKLDTLPLPVVFDLATTKAAQSVIMLYGHDPDIPIGHFDNVKISSQNIQVSGPISIDNAKTGEIKSAAKNGYPWQASVGLDPDEIEYVAEGKTVTVNGQMFVGPIYVARGNVLREVSILPLGADPSTRVILSAKFGDTMTFEQWVQTLGFDPAALTPEQTTGLKGIYDTMMAAGASEESKAEAKAKAIALKATWGNPSGGNNTGVGSSQGNPTGGNNAGGSPVNTDDPIVTIRSRTSAEIRRCDSIQAHSRTYGNPRNAQGRLIAELAIDEGWTTERAELEMLRAARPNNIHSGPARQDGVTPWQVLHAGLHQTVRMSRQRLESRFNVATLDAAHREYRGRLGLQQTLLEAARLNGYTGRGNCKDDRELREILRAAFSTMDLVDIFANTATVKMLEGYESVDDSWRELAAITSTNDFKEFTSRRIGGNMVFEKIPADGMIPHGTLREGDFTNKVDTYAKMYAITRQDIRNDDQSVLDGIPRMLGRGGVLGLVRAFWVEFMNNSSFFHSSNGNTTTGALSISTLQTAESIFRGLKDADGNYIMATPKLLLVPTGLFGLAEQLHNDRTLVGGPTTPVTNSNPNAGKFRPITSPYLSDTTITGNSTTAWYLLADPNDVPVIEVAFLDGNETPIVESADVDFNQLGIQMRGYWDWGVRKQDPKGGVRSTGV